MRSNARRVAMRARTGVRISRPGPFPGGSAERKTAGAGGGSGVPESGRVFGAGGIRSGGRSAGFEDGVEGLAAAHHEVQVRLGEVAEAAVEDDRQRDVVQGGIVGGRVSPANAAGGPRA